LASQGFELFEKVFEAGPRASAEKFPGGSNGKNTENSKKDRKIALLSFYLLYLYHVWKSSGAMAPPPRCRRP